MIDISISVINTTIGNFSLGEWKNDAMSGKGIKRWTNGDIYDGTN